MKVARLSYKTADGWSQLLPHALDSAQTLVLAFGSSTFGANDTGPFTALAKAFPQAVIVGCSSAGEIANAQVVDDSLSVAVARFEHTRLVRVTTTIDGPADSLGAGTRLAAQLPHDGLRAVLLLSDGLNVNGSPLVEGLRTALPQRVTITGGLAGDGSRFERTWVLDDCVPCSGRIAAVGLYGDRVRVGHGCAGGWSDFGPERRITRAEGNVLFELDGQPALDLYKTYLGDLAAGLPGTALLFPLAVRRDGRDDEPLVRTILAVDDEQHSMTFAGDIPQGGVARLMRTSDDRLIDSAGLAGRQALAGVDGGDALVITISCIGRRLVLGERTDEEVEAVVDGAPAGACHVGFYSYGEISPALPGEQSLLHNQTMTVTVISEAA